MLGYPTVTEVAVPVILALRGLKTTLFRILNEMQQTASKFIQNP